MKAQSAGKHAPTPKRRRDARGRLASDYTSTELYGVVRDVVEHLTGHSPVPEFLLSTITQRAFDRARAPAGRPNAPTARAICMRLAGPRTQGGSLPWRQVLALACADDVNIDRWEIRNQSESQKVWFGRRQLIFALRLAVRARSQETIRPAEYAATRRELIAANRRRARKLGIDPLLERLLPTAGQIESIVRKLRAGEADASTRTPGRDRDHLIEVELVDLVGVDVDDHHDREHDHDHVAVDGEDDVDVVDVDDVDDRDVDEDEEVDRRRPGDDDPAPGRRRGGEWDEALEMAELAPRHRGGGRARYATTPEGMSVPLVIHHFIETHGVENGWPGEKAIRRFALLADTAVAGRTLAWADQLQAARALRDERGLPSPPGLRGTRRPLASVRKPTAPLEGAVPRRTKGSATREKALAALRTYDENAPAGVRRTWQAYRVYAVEHGLMAGSTLQQFGRFQELLKEARKPIP